MAYSELLSKAIASNMRLPQNIADALFWEVGGKYITLKELSESHVQIDFEEMPYEKAKEVTLKVYMESPLFWKPGAAYRPDDILWEIENDTLFGRQHVMSRLQMARLYYDLVKEGRFDW